MSRILIIGGHGKVARLLTPLLAARGDEVSAVIRNAEHTADVEGDGATAVVADVESLDRAELAALFAGHDGVVWAAGAGGGDPERTYAIDRDAAIRSMDAADAAGAKRYVMDEHLQQTRLDWTILGPSGLTLDPPTGRIDVGGESRTVARADVAAVIAAVLADPSTVGRTIEFNAGSTPIADAVKG